MEFLKNRTGRKAGRFEDHLSAIRELQDRRFFTENTAIAFTDLQQLTLIHEVLADCKQLEFRRRLTVTVSDSASPSGAGHSPGRDAQFELYLGACLTLRTGDEVHFAEPDVVVHHRSYRFGFAAKRIKNFKRIDDNVRSARDQALRETKSGRITHGVFAFDISSLINPEFWPATPDVSDKIGKSARSLILEAKDTMQAAVEKRMQDYQQVPTPRFASSVLLLGCAMEWQEQLGGAGTVTAFHNMIQGGKGRDAIRSLGLGD